MIYSCHEGGAHIYLTYATVCGSKEAAIQASSQEHLSFVFFQIFQVTDYFNTELLEGLRIKEYQI